MNAKASGAARLAAIAARGHQAVAELRSGADAVDRWLRYEGPGLLDLGTTPERVRRELMVDVDRLAGWLQIHRLVLGRVGDMIRQARRTRRGKPVRVLDVGAGTGGFLFRLEDWAHRQRIPVELQGVEVDERTLHAAQRQADEEGRRVRFVRGDARDLDGVADGSVDVAVSSFVLHHLDPGDAACVLAELDRVAAVNFLVFDLRRNLASVPALWALVRLARFGAPTRHDAMTSLRKGYTEKEVLALLAAADVPHHAVSALPPAFVVASRA